MELQYEQIFQFYIQRLTGNLTYEDELLIESMLLENEYFIEVWKSLEVEANGLCVHDFLKTIDSKKALEELKLERKKLDSF